MGEMSERSAMTKYRIEPRVAAGLQKVVGQERPQMVKVGGSCVDSDWVGQLYSRMAWT
jgi:hypothetical protein